VLAVSGHAKSVFFTCYTPSGGERGPVTSPAFKAGDSVLSGSNGGFDSHTLPPTIGLKIDCVTDFSSDRTSVPIATVRGLPGSHWPRVFLRWGAVGALIAGDYLLLVLIEDQELAVIAP